MKNDGIESGSKENCVEEKCANAAFACMCVVPGFSPTPPPIRTHTYIYVCI